MWRAYVNMTKKLTMPDNQLRNKEKNDSGMDDVFTLIDELRQGRMVILMDDADRENEGDLVLAAEKVTPAAINFMAREARGLICLTLTPEHCQKLGLPMMVQDNGLGLGTNFTVSIEAATGVTTGISAADRARTIQVAVDPAAKPEDIVTPGHVFPLRARPGGILQRAGHTEAGCDLARLAGFQPAAVIVEIMNDDGSMARKHDLLKFAQRHRLKIGTIADLIQHRMLHEQTVTEQDRFVLNTEFGEFTAVQFADAVTGRQHLALVKGELQADRPTLVRVQAGHWLRDLTGAMDHMPHWTFRRALRTIQQAGQGVAVLLDDGRHDFAAELAQLRLNDQETGSGHKPASQVYQDIGTGSQILRSLGVGKMRLMSPPLRFPALSGFGLEITEYMEI